MHLVATQAEVRLGPTSTNILRTMLTFHTNEGQVVRLYLTSDAEAELIEGLKP